MIRWGTASIAITWACTASGQSPVLFTSVQEANLIDAGTGRVEARLRADIANWDMRLAFDGTPKPTDSTANLLNGRGAFDNTTFGFSIEFASMESVYAFSVTGPDRKVQSVKASASDIGRINAIAFATSGSKGKVSLGDIAMKGGGFAWSDRRELTSSPWGPTTSETLLYLGDRVDLTATDWIITGGVSFGELSNGNPSEGAKMTVTLFNAIPSPASAGLIAAAALVAVRRRR